MVRGMGWKALHANNKAVFERAVCGKCLTAKGSSFLSNLTSFSYYQRLAINAIFNYCYLELKTIIYRWHDWKKALLENFHLGSFSI